jgi:hypothetical protein
VLKVSQIKFESELKTQKNVEKRKKMKQKKLMRKRKYLESHPTAGDSTANKRDRQDDSESDSDSDDSDEQERTTAEAPSAAAEPSVDSSVSGEPAPACEGKEPSKAPSDPQTLSETPQR